MSETTDSICGFPTYKPYCLGCKAPLLLENAWMSEGCPCNSKAGCNTINGTRWRLLRDLQQQQSDELATLRAQVAQLVAKVREQKDEICQLHSLRQDLQKRIAELEEVEAYYHAILREPKQPRSGEG